LIWRSLFNKNQNSPALPLESARLLGTDFHNHILPGIDDGATKVGDSLEMLKVLQNLGYKKVITTPHVMAGQYRNSPDIIQTAAQELFNAIKNSPLDIQLEVAAEYMLDELFDSFLQQDKLLSFGSGPYVLVECPFSAPPPLLQQYLFDLQLKGYKPILAHPERYPYWWPGHPEMEDLLGQGLLLQLNLLSFTGNYGKAVQKKAWQYWRKGLVDFLGSDLHQASQSPALQKALLHPDLQEGIPHLKNPSL
jgi:tyrosine-protein phosphatase YwqE